MRAYKVFIVGVGVETPKKGSFDYKLKSLMPFLIVESE
jgi:hypothetical protein